MQFRTAETRAECFAPFRPSDISSSARLCVCYAVTFTVVEYVRLSTVIPNQVPENSSTTSNVTNPYHNTKPNLVISRLRLIDCQTDRQFSVCVSSPPKYTKPYTLVTLLFRSLLMPLTVVGFVVEIGNWKDSCCSKDMNR